MAKPGTDVKSKPKKSKGQKQQGAGSKGTHVHMMHGDMLSLHSIVHEATERDSDIFT